MIEWIKSFVLLYPKAAPLVITLSFVLAGFSIPISADLIILIAATLAATVLKNSFISLYLSVFIGSILAAYIAYAQGRFLSSFLMEKKIFKKLFPEDRLAKIKTHYENHSWATLIIGRFIPFGFRNALFLSTGLAKFSFKKLMVRDAIAAFLWSFTLFIGFYKLVQTADDLALLIKKFNLIIFLLIALSIVAVIWYKQIKKRRLTT